MSLEHLLELFSRAYPDGRGFVHKIVLYTDGSGFIFKVYEQDVFDFENLQELEEHLEQKAHDAA